MNELWRSGQDGAIHTRKEWESWLIKCYKELRAIDPRFKIPQDNLWERLLKFAKLQKMC